MAGSAQNEVKYKEQVRILQEKLEATKLAKREMQRSNTARRKKVSKCGHVVLGTLYN